MPVDLSIIRNEYSRGRLDESHIDPDPLKQFEVWMGQAIDAGTEEPTAMTLATAGEDGRPSARMVLLKDHSQSGFTFYTNYNSRKALHLVENPYSALVFYWKELERQVRIEGPVERLQDSESDAYFSLRPVESQISAIISPQSEVIPNRQHLLYLKEKYLRSRTGDIERPKHWGGYNLKPEMIEFWQGRPGRLHDRIRYSLEGMAWKIERLAP